MQDIDKALKDISDIRSQITAGMMFQGFGPIVIAVTGALALIMATAQTIWPQDFASSTETYLFYWIMTAIVSVALIGSEMLVRSPKHHASLSTVMILNAVQKFLPAGLAGAVIYFTFLYFSPATLWLLPGLWQVFVALGMFAALRLLPPAIIYVGAWYFVSGISVIIIASQSEVVLSPSTSTGLSPWLMGAPFAIGQILMALVLYLANRKI